MEVGTCRKAADKLIAKKNESKKFLAWWLVYRRFQEPVVFLFPSALAKELDQKQIPTGY